MNIAQIAQLQAKNPGRPIIYRASSLEEAAQSAKNGHPVTICNQTPDLETVHRLTSLLGVSHDSKVFAEVRDICCNSNSNKSIALSHGCHPPHTDGTFDVDPPSLFFLQCVRPDENGGGISTFWSIAELLDKMPAYFHNILRQTPVKFERQDDNGTAAQFIGPMLCPRPNGKTALLRYRNDDQVQPQPIEGDTAKFHEALAWVKTYLAQTPPVEYQAASGDLIVVNNDLVLHGRTALSPNSNRLVRRVWLSNQTD